MSAALNQELQEMILQTLDAEGTIADTSKLVLHSQPVDQQVAQAVLTSLASRHVLPSSSTPCDWFVLITVPPIDCQI